MFLRLSLFLTLLATIQAAHATTCESIFQDEPWANARTLAPAAQQKNAITQLLVHSYFEFLGAANKHGGAPHFLSSQSLAYLLDGLNLHEQARLASVVERATIYLGQKKSHEPGVVLEALQVAGDSEIYKRVLEIDALVSELKKDHKEAVRLALENHDGRGQLYAGRPYSSHLHRVRDVLKRFGYGPQDSLMGLLMGTAAWLHDIIEDTPISRAMLEAALGFDVAEIVFNVTNEPNRPGQSQELRKQITFTRIASRIESRILKLADRIANVEESLRNYYLDEPTKIEKYHKEWPIFKKHLKIEGEAPEMWDHLERLLTDSDYARDFILNHPTF